MFRLTPVVKNIIIINVVIFIAQNLLGNFHLTERLALYRIGSDFFEPYQFFTYMFAHGDLSHIFFNMLMFMFLGVSLEMAWGGRKFLVFYIVTGMGAGILYALIGFYQVNQFEGDMEEYMQNPSIESFSLLVDEHRDEFNKFRYGPSRSMSIYEVIEAFEKNPDQSVKESVALVDGIKTELIEKYRVHVIGASGAVYGVLMAFGLMFPERQLMLLIPPVPIRAKYLVLILGAIAVYSGLADNPEDPVAHLVHLTGMFVAFIYVRYF